MQQRLRRRYVASVVASTIDQTETSLKGTAQGRNYEKSHPHFWRRGDRGGVFGSRRADNPASRRSFRTTGFPPCDCPCARWRASSRHHNRTGGSSTGNDSRFACGYATPRSHHRSGIVIKPSGNTVRDDARSRHYGSEWNGGVEGRHRHLRHGAEFDAGPSCRGAIDARPASVANQRRCSTDSDSNFWIPTSRRTQRTESCARCCCGRWYRRARWQRRGRRSRWSIGGRRATWTNGRGSARIVASVYTDAACDDSALKRTTYALAIAAAFA